MRFPLKEENGTPITEITFVFANEKVGEHKKGVLEFREFNLKRQEKTTGEVAKASLVPVE